MLSAAAQSEDRLARLLSMGLSPTDPGEAGCLHAACAARATDCARLLLDANASPDLRCAGGATPLLVACAHGAIACARLLLEHGATPGLVADDGASPLFAASLLAPPDASAPLVKRLLAALADASVSARSGALPLHAAC